MFDRVAVLYILYLIEPGTQRKRQTKLSNYGHDLKGFLTFGILDFVCFKSEAFVFIWCILRTILPNMPLEKYEQNLTTKVCENDSVVNSQWK